MKIHAFLHSHPPACLALAVGFALIAAGCGKNNGGKPVGPTDTAVAVTVSKVMVKPLDRSLDIVGSLEPWSEATVASQVEGQVQKTLVDFGDRVKARQEIALVDTDSYEALARVAGANVARAQASLANARKSLERIRSLQQSNISSASDLDAAIAAEQQAAAEVKGAEASSAVAQLNLARSHVRAPFDAGVAQRTVNAGDYVKSGAALFRLVDDTSLKFVFQVPERYAGQVRQGQAVVFSVDAFPDEKFQGEVFLVSPAVSTATRSFDVAARVQNSEGKLKANTFAAGQLILQRNVPTSVVPLEAIVSFAGVTKIFVIEQDTARLREVRVGRVQGPVQEVLSGVKEGEDVATSGTTRLYDGAKVRVKTEATQEQNGSPAPAGSPVASRPAGLP